MSEKPFNTTEIVNLFMIDQLVVFFNHPYRGHYGTPEQHEHYEFYYIVSGMLTLSIEGKTAVLKPGQGLLMPPRTIHCVSDFAEDTVLKFCGFMSRGALLAPLCGEPLELSADERTLLSELMDEGSLCFERLPAQSNQAGCRVREGISKGRLQALKNKLEIFFIKLIESRQGGKLPAKRVSVADAVYHYLTDHIADRVTLGQIADFLSLSVPYIKREFSKKYGRGIIDCLLEMKIERAKNLIEETPLNFTQIAEYLSFDSENHFSKTFSKRTGKTPGAYLKDIKNQ